jgi:hypothetical protein
MNAFDAAIAQGNSMYFRRTGAQAQRLSPKMHLTTCYAWQSNECSTIHNGVTRSGNPFWHAIISNILAGKYRYSEKKLKEGEGIWR